MGILTHAITQNAQVIDARIDAYGDQLSYGTEAVMCRFRYITELDRNTNAEALGGAEAMIWFEPTVNISEASIIFADGKYWRIERLIKARRLTNPTVLFYKALVKSHDIAEAS